MKYQSLNDDWVVRQAGTNDWIPAIVPGNVHLDLLAAGLIPDPFVGDNELQVQWVAESDWEYKLNFAPNKELLSHEHIFLVADGVDTIAEVKLNGVHLCYCDNMFCTYRWELGSILEQGENELIFNFSSPVKYISHRQALRPMQGVTHAIDGAPHIRKAPCHFGWDWGPKLPSLGIWKDIRLEGFSVARLDYIQIKQVHEKDDIYIYASISVQNWAKEPLKVQLRIITPSNEVFDVEENLRDGFLKLHLRVDEPQLWWPNGYGDQPLYQLEINLIQGNQTIDSRNFQIGLRTIELRQEPDKWGRSFTFVVNNVPIFVKGSNWIPADSFLPRVSDDHLEGLIRSAAETHQNMLRVWGGGVYGDEQFYDLCDRYGLLVWQDFIFACSIYPLDDEQFLKNVKSEVVDNILRIHHRASLALWCGNNEMEWGWESWGWSKIEDEDMMVAYLEKSPSLRQYLHLLKHRDLHPEWETLREAYRKFFHEILPSWVSELDPQTPYWPSSPSSNTPFIDSNGIEAGNTHNWDVWHGDQPFEAYREHASRFVSEFGFQSLPPIDTIRTFAAEEDWNLSSYIMEHHQRNQAGNRKIMAYLGEYFRLPRDFSSLVYLTQVLQSEAVRIGVEYWRRNCIRTSGTLYWQLNDCWPVASWSSLDYYGRWKALHYAARRFYEPVMLSIEESGLHVGVHVTNDRKETWEGELDWSLETLNGQVLAGGIAPVIAPPLANHPMVSLDFSNRISDQERRQVVFICELRADDELLRRKLSLFVPIKHLYLQDPKLRARANIEGEKLEIQLSAKSLARFVELHIDGADLVFSDNYFDIPAGRSVSISTMLPDGWSLEKFQKAFRVRSLYDSF